MGRPVTALVLQGLTRRLVHGVPAQGLFPAEPQHWEWQAHGRFRPTEIQARADLALLDAGEGIVDALRIVLFLATEGTGGDPDDDEAAALLTVMALIDLMEVADA